MTLVKIDNHKDFILEVYSSFYKKQYGSQPKIPKGALVENFLKKIQNTGREINYNYLYKFLCFSWSYWARLDTQFNISINWLLSEKLIDKFINRVVSHDYVISKNRELFNSQHIFNRIKKESTFDLDEYLRKNESKIDQFNFCKLQDLSYCNKSNICKTCSFSDECQQKQKKQNFRQFLLCES